MKWLAAAIALLTAGAAAGTTDSAGRPPAPRTDLPADLPLDRQGMPTRPLDDAELHRLLLALSARNDAATVLLARCHAAGQGYGTPGWRACVEGKSGSVEPRD